MVKHFELRAILPYYMPLPDLQANEFSFHLMQNKKGIVIEFGVASRKVNNV